MQNFSIPTLYAIRYYCMKCSWGQKILCLASGLTSSLSTQRIHDLLAVQVKDPLSLFFWPLYHVMSAYNSVSGPQGCVWVQRCSIHMVVRGRDNHVGNLTASSRGCTRMKTVKSPSQVTHYFHVCV